MTGRDHLSVVLNPLDPYSIPVSGLCAVGRPPVAGERRSSRRRGIELCVLPVDDGAVERGLVPSFFSARPKTTGTGIVVETERLDGVLRSYSRAA